MGCDGAAQLKESSIRSPKGQFRQMVYIPPSIKRGEVSIFSFSSPREEPPGAIESDRESLLSEIN
ncbi:hypothetical protein V2J09_016219 [Rumex salicifolius]